MLQVTKRKGDTQAYSPAKVRNSLIALGDENNMPLNGSDIDLIVALLEEILSEKTHVTTKQIYTILVGVLAVEGFSPYAKLFVGHPGNAWAKGAVSKK